MMVICTREVEQVRKKLIDYNSKFCKIELVVAFST